MNIGVVGTGMIAQLVVEHLNDWGCPVGAVCGTPQTADQVHDLALRSGSADEYVEYGQMLQATDIDTVYIAVPNFLHYSFAKQALESGKHVIVEKPFTSNYEEAKELADMARSLHLMVFEAISTLHLPNYRLIGGLLDLIGTVKLVSLNYSQYSSRYDAFRSGETLPAFDPAKSGGALMDLGLYCVHYVLGLFGKPESCTYLPNIERGIDTSGVMTMTFAGFKAVCVAAKDCAAPVSVCIQGTDGYILQTTPPNNCGAVTLHLNDGTEEDYNDNPELQWESEFRAFGEMLTTGDFDCCYELLDHSLAVSELMTKARRDAGIVFAADNR